jgi:hypothetical protein
MIRDFFCFSPQTKGSKAGLLGNFQIASFPYGNAENMFYNFVVFFSSVKNARTCSLFFFQWREKFLCALVQKLAGATLYLLYKVGEEKKRFLK